MALTEQGLQLAQTIRQCMDEYVDIYTSEKLVSSEAEKKSLQVHTFTNFKEAAARNFSAYEGLIFVMAAGIVVRTIAPLLEDKLTDPAVVVFDEQGRHGISLLSGHVGGANELTRQLCQSIGATAVITTATDIQAKLAPDILANRLGLRPWPKVRIKTMNAGLLAGKKIHWRIDRTLPHSVFYKRKLEQYGQTADLYVPSQLLVVLPEEQEQLEVVIMGERQLPELSELPSNILCLTPRRLIAGVGCRRGTPAALVMSALDTACRMIGRDRSFIDELASTIVKRHEAGILYAGDSLVRPVRFYENDRMQQMIEVHQLEKSAFVQEHIGIGNVCEAAAYCSAGKRGGRLALRKTNFEKVTVALLWEK
ncbi:cobalamin biosynthesis protein [Selenomonas sp.]|uniref:cobalt-precorrin 5A hydrolase n=1 Tax=Selenomonas sp. TaxID=2053611 RepID=UPI0025F6BC9C|nr:cobalamin biosynthesis protein [Selenomonas sp.]